jgi:hypothetical protein
VIRVHDGAVSFQDQILVDGPDRADLLLGDQALSLPAAILTYCLKQGAREITASDAALDGQAFRPDRRGRYRVVAVTGRNPPHAPAHTTTGPLDRRPDQAQPTWHALLY